MGLSADINIQDVRFIVYPYIANKDNGFFLVYKINKGKPSDNRLIIGEKRTANKYYYFFAGRNSFFEYDHTVHRIVPNDEKIIKLFKSGSVFWLNPDKTEIKLKIVNE